MVKYPNIRKSKLTHKAIAKAFGYASVNSFRCSSAHQRIMQGIENVLTLCENHGVKISKD